MFLGQFRIYLSSFYGIWDDLSTLLCPIQIHEFLSNRKTWPFLNVFKKLVTTYHGCLWWGFSPRFRLDLKELEPFTGVIGTIKGRMKEVDFLGWNLSWTSPSSWFVDVGTASMLVSVLWTFQCDFRYSFPISCRRIHFSYMMCLKII